jgi:hypothetical protein
VEVKEESEKEDEPVPKSVKKTPRKSVKEDPGAFSDYNPFQSGSEVAAERERRRRRVCTVIVAGWDLLTFSHPSV